MKMINYLNDNREWIFDGIGVFILSGIASAIVIFLKKIYKSKKKEESEVSQQINQKQKNIKSSGVQIGIQNKYKGDKDKHG